MDKNCTEDFTTRKGLCKLLKAFDTLLSINWKECKTDDALSQLHAFEELLVDHNVDVTDEKNRTHAKCNCQKENLHCVVSAIALQCALYVKALSDEVGNDVTCTANFKLTLSLQEEQYLTRIIEFVISNGLIYNLEFEISILIPRSLNTPLCSKKHFFESLRCLLSIDENSNVKRLLFPKHLLPILGALMQLVYSPNIKGTLSSHEVSFCKKSLLKLMSSLLNLKDLANCLLILQGSSSRLSPVWLQKACGFLLSKCLLRDNGVHAVISAFLSTFDNDMSAWKKAEVASHILSTPPRSFALESYYSNILSQIFALFRAHLLDQSEVDPEKVMIQTLTATVFALYQKSPGLTNHYFFTKLFWPLSNLYTEDKLLEDAHIGITTCVEILHQLFVMFNHACRDVTFRAILLPHLPGLFVIFSWSRNSISHLRSLLQQLLANSLKSLELDSAASVLLSLIGVLKNSPVQLYVVRDDLTFINNESGEISTSQMDISFKSPEEVIDDQNNKVLAIIDLITSSKIEKLPARILILLLKEIENLSSCPSFEANDDQLLTNDEKASLHLQSGESQLLAYALLTSLCEDGDPKDIFADINEITSFLKVQLERACKPMEDPVHSRIATDSLKLCFALLGMCLFNSSTREQQNAIKDLLPLLQDISRASHLSEEDRNTGSDLAIAVATHGAYSDAVFESFSKSLQEQVLGLERNFSGRTDVDDQVKVVGNNSPSTTGNTPGTRVGFTPDPPHPSSNERRHSNGARRNRSDVREAIPTALDSVNEAISSVYDPCPSVRTAGLRYLTAAIKDGAKEVKERHSKMGEIFLEVLLKEDDSFVYLAAIQALVVVIDRSPMTGSNARNLFDRLLNEYEKNMRCQGDEAEVKALKLGEIVVRLVGKLGDLAGEQCGKLIPILFRGSVDSRAPIRSSCLSNLAELCPLIPHQLSTFKYELSECVCATAISDSDVGARRAAVHVLRNLIESLDSNFLQIFSDLAKRFYSILKRCYNDDGDHVVQLHAQLALEALDSLMRDSLFSSQDISLRKSISVLP